MLIERTGGPAGADALAVAASTKKWAKAQGIHIIHCLIDSSSTPFPTAKDVERLASAMEYFKSSAGDEAPSLVQDSDGEITFTRRIGHVSALKSPGLLEYLEENGIKSLVLTGLSTSGCVLRTAVAGCDAEFVVTVLKDGCADAEQSVHDALVNKVLSNRGFVYSADEFCAGWERGELCG